MDQELLYPFFDTEGMEEGLSYIKKDQRTRLIAHMARLSGDERRFAEGCLWKIFDTRTFKIFDKTYGTRVFYYKFEANA